MILPFLETATGRVLPLQNFYEIRDESADDVSRVVFVARGGTELTFVEEEADELLGQLETLIAIGDSLQLPIVGVTDRILILPNFLMFDIDENEETGARTVTLTDDAATDYGFAGDDAVLICARLDVLTTGIKSLLAAAAQQAEPRQ